MSDQSPTPNPQSPGPLHGIRVVECGHMVGAAYAAKLMADLGAEVIKIEEPGGDDARRRGPYPGDVPHQEKSGLFLYLNTNKLGVTLDLQTDKGQELFRRLVQDTDLLLHNYPPPQMAGRGLDYEVLRNVNPNLVMTSISPFGQNGPRRDYHAHDLTLWSAGGIVLLEWCFRSGRPASAQSLWPAGGHASRGECGGRFARGTVWPLS